MVADSSAKARIKRLSLASFAGHTAPVLGGSLALVLAVTLLPSAVDLPSLATRPAARPTGVVAAWVICQLAMLNGSEPSWQLLATSPRLPRIANLGRSSVVAALLTVATSLVGTDRSFTTTNSTLLLMGLALLSGAVFGHALSWIGPTVYVVAVLSLAGVTPEAGVPNWAYILAKQPSSAQLLLSTAAASAGCIAWWKLIPRQGQREESI